MCIRDRDNVKAHLLQPDGSYEKEDRRGKVSVNSQDQFCQEAVEKARQQLEGQETVNDRVFIPVENPAYKK